MAECVSHGHNSRRYFIGPMPERVVATAEPSVEEGHITRIVKANALRYFLAQGGREEDWGENEEQSTRQELLRHWQASEWGRIGRTSNSQGAATGPRWIGGSFEIGTFVEGVNILDPAPESVQDARSSAQAPSTKATASELVRGSLMTPVQQRHGRSGTDDTAFFSTIGDNPPPSTSFEIPMSGSPPPAVSELLTADTAANYTAAHSNRDPTMSASSSIEPLQPPLEDTNKFATEVHRRAILRPSIVPPSKSDGNVHFAVQPELAGHSPLDAKGKGRLVHYAETSGSTATEQEPASPTEVLQRTGSDVEDTSAGAAISKNPSQAPDIRWGDVVMRDRMLVRVSYSRHEIGVFDEKQNRTTSNLQHEDWAEFMVVWRRDRLELYEDYSTAGKEWLFGHKHLAFVVPLSAPLSKISAYSFVDMTFCITCPPTPVHDKNVRRSIFHRARQGSNIFVFKAKSRTRALDWTWQLWRQLGGEVPPYLEVRCPGLESRVKIDLGVDPTAIFDDFAHFDKDNIIGLCVKSLRKIPNYDFLIEREIQEGRTLELAWRMESSLDWIWLEEDVDGVFRDWAVLCGIALKQKGRPLHLELRLSEHLPTHLHTPHGGRLAEPPGIEGYVERVKPHTQVKQSVYLTTHDGNLFSLTAAHAHPPPPPGIEPAELETENLRLVEVRRGAMQIMDAMGVSDLRNILAVRKAFHTVPEHKVDYKAGMTMEERQRWTRGWVDAERTYIHVQNGSADTQALAEEEEDAGGDEGLSGATDKSKTKVKRAFELLLKSGHVIRFEAYSKKVAEEWIARLLELKDYWEQRHRHDAHEEMDLAHVASQRPRLTPTTHAHGNTDDMAPEGPGDLDAHPALNSLYNWCVLEGCKPVVKGGRLFTRRGLRGQYKLVHMFLVAGQLVQYHITPQSSLHHRRSKKISLIDAYVCSGYFAALALPKDQQSMNANPLPRRYQDGLEADDPEEDMLFVVWYRSQSTSTDAVMVTGVQGGGVDTAAAPGSAEAPLPALSAKRKLVVFRTRSKLERDSWCWALNCEIETIVRATKEREAKLRATGGLVKLK